MNYKDIQFIRIMSNRLERFKEVDKNIYNFRCPSCGDSKKSKTKARGYLFPYKNTFFYKCHNCEISVNLKQFIKRFFNEIYEQYIFEEFQNKKITNEIKFEKPSLSHDISLLSDYRSCNKLLSNNEAVVYLEKRKIPKKFWNNIFYCNDINKLIEKIGNYDHLKEYNISGSYVIVPFISNNEVNYIMARSLNPDSSFRYMLLKTHTEGKKIWGLDYINWKERVYILEGVFDAMMLPNAIAVSGISILQMIKYIHDKSKITLIYDKDFTTNSHVYHQVKKAINMNYEVVLFDQNFPFKDINEAVQSGWSQADLLIYIKSRTFSNLDALLELTQLKIPLKIRNKNDKNRKASSEWKWI